MEIFPIDVQYVIWRKAFSSQVIEELYRHPVHLLWKQPSKTLKQLCKDKGCYQNGYTDLTELIEDHNLIMITSHCYNCEVHKFPCVYCCSFLFDYQIEYNLWDYSM